MTLVKSLFAAFALIALGIQGAFAENDDWLVPGPAVPEVMLRDQDGRKVDLANLIASRPVIVSFFFTGCSSVCPMQTAQLADLQEAMNREAPSGPLPLILSISLDPMSDTPEAIAAFAQKFDIRLGDDGNWLMLTGAYDDLRRVWLAFDQDTTSPEEHAPLFWIGQAAEPRWTRVDTLAEPAQLYRLLVDRPS